MQPKRSAPSLPEKIAYWDLEDLERDLDKIKPSWTVIENNKSVQIGIMVSSYVRLQTVIMPDLSATIHSLPVAQQFSLKDLQFLAPLPVVSIGTYYRHVVCYLSDGHIRHFSTVRSSNYLGKSESKGACANCKYVQTLLRKKEKMEKSAQKPNTSKIPLQTLAKQRLVVAFQEKRNTEARQGAMLKKISEESVPVSDSLHSSLKDVFEEEDLTNPFMKLFWAQQKKAFSTQKGGMRWHPVLLRFAILLDAQSPSTYRTIREIGALKLPGESTLRDYTNAIHPHQGFNDEVIQEIKSDTASLKPHQCWVVLLQDEMTIKADLIHDQTTGDIVGFLDPSSWTGDVPAENDPANHD